MGRLRGSKKSWVSKGGIECYNVAFPAGSFLLEDFNRWWVYLFRPVTCRSWWLEKRQRITVRESRDNASDRRSKTRIEEETRQRGERKSHGSWVEKSGDGGRTKLRMGVLVHSSGVCSAWCCMKFQSEWHDAMACPLFSFDIWVTSSATLGRFSMSCYCLRSNVERIRCMFLKIHRFKTKVIKLHRCFGQQIQSIVVATENVREAMQ